MIIRSAACAPRGRRGRRELYRDLLLALQAERLRAGEAEPVRWSRVQGRVYVPMRRFKQYLRELHELGFLDADAGLLLARGVQFLDAYRGVDGVFSEEARARGA